MGERDFRWGRVCGLTSFAAPPQWPPRRIPYCAERHILAGPHTRTQWLSQPIFGSDETPRSRSGNSAKRARALRRDRERPNRHRNTVPHRADRSALRGEAQRRCHPSPPPHTRGTCTVRSPTRAGEGHCLHPPPAQVRVPTDRLEAITARSRCCVCEASQWLLVRRIPSSSVALADSLPLSWLPPRHERLAGFIGFLVDAGKSLRAACRRGPQGPARSGSRTFPPC